MFYSFPKVRFAHGSFGLNALLIIAIFSTTPPSKFNDSYWVVIGNLVIYTRSSCRVCGFRGSFTKRAIFAEVSLASGVADL